MVNFQSMSGSQRRCSCIDVKQDLNDEVDEMFSILALSSDPLIGFESNRTTLTIIDDDGGYKLYVSFSIVWIVSLYVWYIYVYTYF